MLLITPNEVLHYAFATQDQISPNSIKLSKILTCSEHYIRPRFGDNLYDKFTDGKYTTFVDEYLKPTIAHYVRYAIIDELSIQLSDNGAININDQEQQATQTKQNTSTHTSQNKTVGEDTINGQLIASSRNATKITTTNDKDLIVELDKNSQEDSKTLGETTKNQTEVRDRTTTTTDEINKTADTAHNSTKMVEVDDTKERDYSFHESPQVVGVSTVGNSHDVQDKEERTTNTLNGNDVSSENREGSTLFKTNDKLTDTDKTDQTSVKNGLYTSAQHSIDASTGTRNDEILIERQDSTNRTAETNRQSDQSDQRTTADDGRLNSTLRQRTSVSDHQRNVIRVRALADANILLARAVRYVERNREQFPEYKPGKQNYGRIVM